MREELGAGEEGGGRAFQNKSLGKQKENVHQVEEKGRRGAKQKLEVDGILD